MGHTFRSDTVGHTLRSDTVGHTMTSVAQNSEISEGVVPRGSRKEPPGRSEKMQAKGSLLCVIQ